MSQKLIGEFKTESKQKCSVALLFSFLFYLVANEKLVQKRRLIAFVKAVATPDSPASATDFICSSFTASLASIAHFSFSSCRFSQRNGPRYHSLISCLRMNHECLHCRTCFAWRIPAIIILNRATFESCPVVVRAKLRV